MNYDFKTNWNDVVLPLLSRPSIKRSIKKGIVSFIKSYNKSNEKVYDCKKCPAEYSTNDSWYTYLEDYTERLSKKLLETGFLKPEPEYEFVDDDISENSEFMAYQDYKEDALRVFIEHHKKTSLRAYQMFGACHWWNPTFGLALAKLIYPNEKWCVIYGDFHTTIVNTERTLVFDILYFDENDSTYGGKTAIEESMRK
jgi:hypothetical protein